MKLVESIASVGTVRVEPENKEMTRLDRLNRGSTRPLTSLPSLTSAPLASLCKKEGQQSGTSSPQPGRWSLLFWKQTPEKGNQTQDFISRYLSRSPYQQYHDSRCKAPHLLPCCRVFWNNQVRALRNKDIIEEEDWFLTDANCAGTNKSAKCTWAIVAQFCLSMGSTNLAG